MSTANLDWGRYPNFSESEFRCSHCGSIAMKPEFLERLQRLRTAYGRPMRITSGYRCPQHPIEARKPTPGAHASGEAADIGVNGQEAYKILALAFDLGFSGIGVNIKGGAPFVHLDTLTSPPRPNVWSY